MYDLLLKQAIYFRQSFSIGIRVTLFCVHFTSEQSLGFATPSPTQAKAITSKWFITMLYFMIPEFILCPRLFLRKYILRLPSDFQTYCFLFSFDAPSFITHKCFRTVIWIKLIYANVYGFYNGRVSDVIHFDH